MNPEERPNLQDYKDKELANTNTCQDCNKEFFSRGIDHILQKRTS